MTPCQEDAEKWFSENQADLEFAQKGCSVCPVKVRCYAGAIERREPHGVWGGVLLSNGKPGRLRGRPKKSEAPAG